MIHENSLRNEPTRSFRRLCLAMVCEEGFLHNLSHCETVRKKLRTFARARQSGNRHGMNTKGHAIRSFLANAAAPTPPKPLFPHPASLAN